MNRSMPRKLCTLVAPSLVAAACAVVVVVASAAVAHAQATPPGGGGGAGGAGGKARPRGNRPPISGSAPEPTAGPRSPSPSPAPPSSGAAAPGASTRRRGPGAGAGAGGMGGGAGGAGGGAPGRAGPLPAGTPAPGHVGGAGAGAGAGANAGAAVGGAGGELPDSIVSERAATQCKKLNERTRYKWDQKGEIDLAALLAWAQASFCKPLIVPSNLRQQKISIYAPNTMTPGEMYRMFLSALNAMGLTIQPQGPKSNPTALVIIESGRAHETAIPVVGPDEQPPANDSYVTKVQRLEHLTTDEVNPLLMRLKSQNGDIVAAPPQTLIITDVSDNIRRMEEVLAKLDLPLGGERIWVVKLHSVGATEMANMLKEIFQPKSGAGAGGQVPRRPIVEGRAPVPEGGAVSVPGNQPATTSSGGGDLSVSQIIPDDRSNTLIIVATERAYQRILGLVHRLDQQGGPFDSSSDRVHVYFLANANAEDLAGTLSGVGVGVSGGRGGGRGGRPGGGAQPAQPGQGASLFENEVRVASDKATNSLIIVASGKDYVTLRDLIRQLDVSRRQVFIEATILEISLDKARKLGFGAHGGDTVDTGGKQSLLFGGTEPNQSVNSILFSPAALSGLAAGFRGPNIPEAATILGLPPGTSIPSFGVFIQAIQNNNDVNVISMPHILTSDNEKASIQVGRNLPFPGSLGGFPGLGAVPGAAGAAAGAGGLGFGFGTSVQRQDVALKLDVTPHVNSSDYVRLEVDNEISDVASENFNGLGPATDKRTVKTVVVVRDQQSVVLGGLVKDRIAESVDKVPLLGDIPILGYLFKYTRKTILKQNLLIILTPYIIKDPLDLRRIFERKIRERKEFLERYSAFQDTSDYEAHVDYRRKRGLLQEINVVATEAETEARELRAIEQGTPKGYEGPVEPAPIDWGTPVDPPPLRPQGGDAMPPSGPENNYGGTRPPSSEPPGPPPPSPHPAPPGSAGPPPGEPR